MKYLIVALFVLSACQANRGFVKVKWPEKPRPKYYLNGPKGDTYFGFRSPDEREYHYIYDDSSYAYISSYSIIPNQSNIKDLGDTIHDFRFRDQELARSENEVLGRTFSELLPDTFELSGIDRDSLYWKDIIIRGMSIGYINVPKDRKALFDASLKTFRAK